MMDNSDLTWKIGGEAGFGIMVSGLNFGRTMMRGGFQAFESNEYPSLIRGGHNTETVRIASRQVTSLTKEIHFLVALNKETIHLHKQELVDEAAVLFDPTDCQVSEADFPKKVRLYPIPLFQLAKERGGDILMRNTIAIGASLAVLDFDLHLFHDVLTNQFKRKGEAVVEQNKALASAGYEYMRAHFPNDFRYRIKPQPTYSQRVFITASEAIGLASIAANMQFFAAYPMTPINGLIHYLASVQDRAGFIYKQPEDEIAAINMAIGASFAGVRSMVATSGGGYALMVEGTSLSGMTETPVVIVYGMRPGPATGLPTWTGQTDLKFVLNAGHGEFPRLIVAPGDVEEAFSLTMKAFNLADRYQTPTFILTDKYLNESRMTIESAVFRETSQSIPIDRGKLLNESEQNQQAAWDRYAWSEDGISSRPIPGRKQGVFRANSDEHTPDGYSTEDADVARRMVEKRMQKQKRAQNDVEEAKLLGEREADITLVGWGSTKGVASEAIQMLKAQNVDFKVNYLHINWLNPFPIETVKAILSSAKKTVSIEGAYLTPLSDYIHEKTGQAIRNTIHKYDGRPFYPEDLIAGLKAYG